MFKKAIKDNLNRRYLINPRGVFHLGPPLYMQSVTEVVFGERQKRKPGSNIMEQYRTLLKNSKHFQTYKENLPNDSLIFKYNQATFKNGNGMSKEDFYKSQSITPWDSGIDKNSLILVIVLIVVIILFYLYEVIG